MTTFLERLRADPARVRLERLARLQGLTEELSAAQTRDEVVRVIFERGLGLVDAATVCLYWERSPGELALVQSLGVTEDAASGPPRVGAQDPLPVAEAHRTGRPVWLATGQEVAARFPAALRPGEVRHAVAAVPVSVGPGKGVLALAFREARAFDEEEQSFILALARQCTTAVERARLFDDRSRAAERLRHLFGAAAVLSAAATPRDVAAAAFRGLGALGACAAEIHETQGEDKVALLARHGRAPEERGAPIAVDLPFPAAEVVRTGKALWLENPEEIDLRFPHAAEQRAEREEGAWAVVPLLSSGRALGALLAAFPSPRRIEADDRTFIRLVAQPCAQALDRRRLVDDALRARTEAEWTAALLTGLTNAVPVGIALLDRHMRFVRVNAKFAGVDGVPVEAHAGRSPLEILPGSAGEDVVAAYRAVIGQGATVERVMEVDDPGTPGVRFRFATTWFPVRVNGEIAGVGGLVRERG